jgi:hypothetical protein
MHSTISVLKEIQKMMMSKPLSLYQEPQGLVERSDTGLKKPQKTKNA